MAATNGLAAQHGGGGFYTGWWPGFVGKISSYALTWTFFQQLKRVRDTLSNRPATDVENSIMGCLASATTVCIMIPMDTIKTRLVTQAGRQAIAAAAAKSATGAAAGSIVVPYKGIVDCAIRVAKEEGLGAFYRGLPPRLVSVVPMIGIQFGVYEFMRKVMLQRQIETILLTQQQQQKNKQKHQQQLQQEQQQEQRYIEEDYDREQVMKEAAMEVAASPERPYPAPHFHKVLPQLEDIVDNSNNKNKNGKQQVKTQAR